MKMWDEVGDPNSKEAKMRRNTEGWLRAQLPAPDYDWTPGGMHVVLMRFTAEAQRAKQSPETWYAANRKFLNELLLVFEGEGLVECRVKRTKGRKQVINAFPVRGGGGW